MRLHGSYHKVRHLLQCVGHAASGVTGLLCCACRAVLMACQGHRLGTRLHQQVRLLLYIIIHIDRDTSVWAMLREKWPRVLDCGALNL
jgi:hypothetical protein